MQCPLPCHTRGVLTAALLIHRKGIDGQKGDSGESQRPEDWGHGFPPSVPLTIPGIGYRETHGRPMVGVQIQIPEAELLPARALV